MLGVYKSPVKTYGKYTPYTSTCPEEYFNISQDQVVVSHPCILGNVATS